MFLANLKSQPHLKPQQKTKTKVGRSNASKNYSHLLSSLLVRPQVRKMSGDSESKVDKSWRWRGCRGVGSRRGCQSQLNLL